MVFKQSLEIEQTMGESLQMELELLKKAKKEKALVQDGIQQLWFGELGTYLPI